ncbi:hypothetical protein PsorP6_016504 [Peronosclerospora sorghi]|uniref:Uncharacterized protein n=1 Tax=Peronosclerospora sorghi TaxID=230839 RepID=A0ACC0VQ48_9STRA|nr:hypothetical protein PsorP6_016504 [Peronosclerospora sorghi]
MVKAIQALIEDGESAESLELHWKNQGNDMFSDAKRLIWFIEYTKMMEGQTGKRLKCVRTNNGIEFCNNKFDGFCLQHGILHQTSAPYSPQQNGIAERAN